MCVDQGLTKVFPSRREAQSRMNGRVNYGKVTFLFTGAILLLLFCFNYVEYFNHLRSLRAEPRNGYPDTTLDPSNDHPERQIRPKTNANVGEGVQTSGRGDEGLQARCSPLIEQALLARAEEGKAGKGYARRDDAPIQINGEGERSSTAHVSDCSSSAIEKRSDDGEEGHGNAPGQSFDPAAVCSLTYPSVVGGTYVLASKAYKIGYVRVGKCASKQIKTTLSTHLNDLKQYALHDVPEDWFLFTFIRSPLTLSVSAYAEIEGYIEGKIQSSSLSKRLTYWKLPRDNPARFPLFLDELFKGRFGANSADHFYPAHAYPITVTLTSVMERLNFIGKLEEMEEDWKTIALLRQDLPSSLRGLAGLLPRERNRKSNRFKVEAKEGVVLSDNVLCKIVRYYASDFSCFNYSFPIAPERCPPLAFIPRRVNNL